MPHVAVVGAGVFGVWTAHHLRERGMQVTLIDAYGPGNSRSSSGGATRIVRCGYGDDEIYSEMARRSRAQWARLDARLAGAAPPVWHRCGVLWLAGGDDPYTQATRATLERSGITITVLDRQALRARYPQLAGDGLHWALLEPDAGVVLARRAVQMLAVDLERRGVRVCAGRASSVPGRGVLHDIQMDEGDPVRAEMFVFACGAWLPQLFPDLLSGRIRPTRQTVLYFGPPPGNDRFSGRRLPAWVDFPAGIYGVPDVDGRGLKVGIDAHGPAFDPDRDDRLVRPDAIEAARAWLRRRIPAMAAAPVVEGRVCQYENTSTGDFLIDRHPAFENVWIVGGGSGHGFKHGPAVGELAAGLVAAGGTPPARFSLAAKGVEPHRAVY